MSYMTQAKLAADQMIMQRATACAALEQIPDPGYWVQARVWQFSAQPGWDDAYASAIAGQKLSPGADESVIMDQMILAAVQKLNTPPETPAE